MVRLIAGLLLLAWLTGCGPQHVGPPIGDRSAAPLKIPGHHLVRTGDTLYSIAFMYGFTVEDVAGWNRIREPYTIFKGQQLRLTAPPAAPSKAVRRPVPAASQPKIQPRAIPAPSRPKTAGSTVAVTPSLPKTDPSPVTASRPKTAAADASPARQAATPRFARQLSWGWPADGPLVSRFSTRSTGKKGISIAGQAGAAVRAAAAGKVVYAGSGLSGYGRLIIIKHNDEFLSAYAHNRKLLATEGQWIKKHDVIAHMGSSGTDRTALHFEIRKRGRPVNPLNYLPKR